MVFSFIFFFFQAEDGIRDIGVTGVQTCALPIYSPKSRRTLSMDWRGHGESEPARGDFGESPSSSEAEPVLWVYILVWASAQRESRSEERRVGKEWRARGVRGRARNSETGKSVV